MRVDPTYLDAAKRREQIVVKGIRRCAAGKPGTRIVSGCDCSESSADAISSNRAVASPKLNGQRHHLTVTQPQGPSIERWTNQGNETTAAR